MLSGIWEAFPISQYEEYVTEKGYNATDLIGKDGIEASMESYLKGVKTE